MCNNMQSYTEILGAVSQSTGEGRAVRYPDILKPVRNIDFWDISWHKKSLKLWQFLQRKISSWICTLEDS